MEKELIVQDIINIIKKSAKHDVCREKNLELSSLETLVIVAEIEKTFNIEIENNKIFRGLFNSLDTIAGYVFDKCSAESSR